MLGGNGGRSGVMCEGSPYIYPPFKVAASQSNGSGIENGVEVSLADVSWDGWVLPIVLCNEVRCQQLFNISSTFHSSSPSTTMGGGGDGDQREFDLETRVTTNGNRIISKMFHSCALNK